MSTFFLAFHDPDNIIEYSQIIRAPSRLDVAKYLLQKYHEDENGIIHQGLSIFWNVSGMSAQELLRKIDENPQNDDHEDGVLLFEFREDSIVTIGTMPEIESKKEKSPFDKYAKIFVSMEHNIKK